MAAYTSNQITCSRNSKKLIEFLDKMTPAQPQAYAHLHAGEEELGEGERKSYSLIGVAIADYSEKGSGGKTKYASFNLSPQDVKQIAADIGREIDRVFIRESLGQVCRQGSFLVTAACNMSVWLTSHSTKLFSFLGESFGFAEGDGNVPACGPGAVDRDAARRAAKNPFAEAAESVVYSADKIIAASKDQDGTSPMSRIMIRRLGLDQGGQPRRSPWQVSIDNGRAVAEATQTGGTKAKSGSFRPETSLSVWLTDREIEKMFRSACDYIRVFEDTQCCQAVKAGRAAYAAEKAQRNI